MLAVERRNLILEKLQDEKSVVVSELSELFEVSEETIRRDLDKMEKMGLATKTYGGAVLVENSNADMPFSVRKKKNMRGKRVIAGIVSGLISDGDHIILDPSTTTVAIVNALKDKKRLTLVVNRDREVPVNLFAVVEPNPLALQICGRLPFKIPEESREMMVMALQAINQRLPVGRFQMDMSDGTVDYRVSLPLLGRFRQVSSVPLSATGAASSTDSKWKVMAASSPRRPYSKGRKDS